MRRQHLAFAAFCVAAICTVVVLQSMGESRPSSYPSSKTTIRNTGWPFIDDTHSSDPSQPTISARQTEGTDSAIDYAKGRNANLLVNLILFAMVLRTGFLLVYQFPQYRLTDLFALALAAAIVSVTIRVDPTLAFLSSEYRPRLPNYSPLPQSSRPLWQNIVALTYCFFAYYAIASYLMPSRRNVQRGDNASLQ